MGAIQIGETIRLEVNQGETEHCFMREEEEEEE